MNVKDHPELEELQKYLINSAAAEYSELRLHLAQCSECRSQVDGLNALKHISQLPAETLNDTLTATLTEAQHQQIQDYINDDLSLNENRDEDHKKHERKQTEQLIQSNPAAMKAALHLTSNKALQERMNLSTVPSNQESSNQESSSLESSKDSLFSTLTAYIKSLFSYQTPLWIGAPLTAALVALLSITLFEQNTTQPPYTIASYQDNPIIQFRSKDNLPGIGFFAKSEISSATYDGLQVKVSDESHFELRWPAISNAVKYKLRLHRFNQGSKTLVNEITTDKTSVIIETESAEIFSRYEWALTGETSDERTFMAKGGFVINPSIQGKK